MHHFVSQTSSILPNQTFTVITVARGILWLKLSLVGWLEAQGVLEWCLLSPFWFPVCLHFGLLDVQQDMRHCWLIITRPRSLERRRLLSKLCQRDSDDWEKYWRSFGWIYCPDAGLEMVFSCLPRINQLLNKPIRSFYSECPVVLLAIILVAWKLEVPKREGHIKESPWTKLKRVDFIGSAFLSASIIACLLALNFFSNAESWSNLVPIVLAVVAIFLIIAFCLVEKLWAKEPIFPLDLLTKLDTCTSYIILACQMAAQLAVRLNRYATPK